jgi:hypothetical protein
MALELAASALHQHWDLVITSPLMNEVGVILGKKLKK